MPRVFGHYVPGRVLVLASGEATITFASVFVGPALPMVGIAAIRSTWGDAIPTAAVLATLVLAMAHVAGLYDTRQAYGRRELLLRLAMAFAGAYLLIAVLGYLLSPLMLTRKAFLLSFATAFPSSLLVRLVHESLTSASRIRRRVLLLGAGQISDMIAKAIMESHHAYELVGCLEGNGRGSADVRSLGGIEDLGWVSKVALPDVIVVALEERRGTLPISEIVECKLRGIEVDDWPSFYEKVTGKIPLSNLRPSWLVFADGFRPARLTRIVKRVIDLSVSATVCLVSLPVMLVVAVMIRLDSPGPVFFRQERLGQFGRVFSIFKFRSMRIDAHLLPAPPPGKADPRVTRAGRFLRRTRLDELPQLFNVLLGHMSLVGPRPEWVALVPEFREKVPLYLHRLAAKPGITGWAQVRNPYGATVENTWEKLQYDLYYIKNMSIFLDLLILLHTIQIVLFTRGSGEWKNRKQPQSTTSVSYAG